MPLGAVLLIAFVVVLVVVWLLVASKEQPIKRRNTADYQHQHTGNPDYFPGQAGGAAGG